MQRGKERKSVLRSRTVRKTGNKGVLAFQKYSELVSGSLEKKILVFSSYKRKGKRERGRWERVKEKVGWVERWGGVGRKSGSK